MTDKDFFFLFWIETEGLLDKYMDNHRNCGVFIDESWDDYFYRRLLGDRETFDGARSFVWNKSPEGFDYWSKVELRFLEFFSEMCDERK